MNINRETRAGTLESNDCIVHLFPNEGFEIVIDSSVEFEFGDQIRDLITNLKKRYDLENTKVFIEDKGALDCTIEARFITALRRQKNEQD